MTRLPRPPTEPAAVFEQVVIEGAQIRLVYSWEGVRYTYRITVEGVTTGRSPDPALAFRVGLGFAPFFAGFLSPRVLVVRAGALDEDEVGRWERWYTRGLAEKSFRHGLDPGTSVVVESDCAWGRAPASAHHGVLLMNGGGKDSAVAAEILREAGVGFRWLSVRPGRAQEAVAEASGVSHAVRVRAGWETVPPLRLFRYEGPAPVLLFYDLVAVLAAEMVGAALVATGNERSADHGNLEWRGVEVNHQYTKSHAFEAELNDLLGGLGSPVRLFSVLRSLWDLQVAELFASLPAYHSAFASCNLGQVGGRAAWCGRCPKCAATALALAPFLPARTLHGFFGRDLLDDVEMLPVFLALAGLEGTKPFECVGTPAEALAAVALAPGDTLALREIRRRVGPDRLAAAAREVRGGWNEQTLAPPEIATAIREAVARLRTRAAAGEPPSPVLSDP